jgi:hypothetical protein
MAPRQAWAEAFPWSADLRYQRTASAKSCGTPWAVSVHGAAGDLGVSVPLLCTVKQSLVLANYGGCQQERDSS